MTAGIALAFMVIPAFVGMAFAACMSDWFWNLRPSKHWRLILTRAWSVRFMVLYLICTFLENVIPYFGETPVFGIAAATFGILAIVSRIIDQKDLPDEA